MSAREPRGARVRDVALDELEALRFVEHGGAGAVVTFVGRVRDHNDGRAVTKLEYTAYVTMAELEIARVEEEVLAAFPGSRVFVSHRIGELQIGEAAVICAASTAHRGEAFDACRHLIDAIKHRVPIWKREFGPDGPYWVGWRDARCHGDDHDGAPAPG